MKTKTAATTPGTQNKTKHVWEPAPFQYRDSVPLAGHSGCKQSGVWSRALWGGFGRLELGRALRLTEGNAGTTVGRWAGGKCLLWPDSGGKGCPSKARKQKKRRHINCLHLRLFHCAV